MPSQGSDFWLHALLREIFTLFSVAAKVAMLRLRVCWFNACASMIFHYLWFRAARCCCSRSLLLLADGARF